MTPVRKAASRLGWVAIGHVVVFGLTIPFTLVFSSVWAWAVGISTVFSITAVSLEDTLYRWVTAPERDAKVDPPA